MEQTLTESEKIEQLMRPRWKIVADYPHSPLPAGSLLDGNGESFCVSRTHYQDFGELHSQNNYMPEAYLYGFPHLFRKLEWWEERAVEEMPEYVKLNPDNTSGGPEVFKVLAVKKFVDGIGICHTAPPDESNPFEEFVSAQYFLPATLADYLTYTQPSPLNQEK